MPMIRYGANVHALTASGFTALDAAQGFKHTSIRRPLGIDGGSSKQRFHRCDGVEWLVGKKFSSLNLPSLPECLFDNRFRPNVGITCFDQTSGMVHAIL